MLWFDSLRRVGTNPRLLGMARLVGLLLTILSVILILKQGITEIAWGDWEDFLLGGLISFIAYGASFILQGIAWCLLISSLARSRPGWRDLEIYAYSNMMRRAPGMVWYLIERMERYRQGGLGARVTLVASAGEWVLLIIAACIVYVLTRFNQAVNPLLIVETLTVSLLFVLGVWILGRQATRPNADADLTQNTNLLERLTASWRRILVVLLIYGMCYGLGGLIVYTLVNTVAPVNQLVFLEAVGVWALTGGIALLGAVVIPVNMGVRDFTLAVVLLPFTSAVSAITVAATVRIVFAIADVIFSLGLWQLAKWAGGHAQLK